MLARWHRARVEAGRDDGSSYSGEHTPAPVDIVTHATTKYMDGHGSCVGGAIVDSGNFDWLAHAEKYMPNGTCGVISFGVPGGREKVSAFLDHLKMIAIATHVADIRQALDAAL